MESVLSMNATSYYGFNNCGLLYATAEQNNPSLAAQRALDLYNLRTRNAPIETAQQQQGTFQQQGNKRERKTQPNRSRTLYNKRLLVNARERERMKTLNKGFENLRNALPCYIADGHISKITTLRLAINYIKSLSAVLQDAATQEGQALSEQALVEQTPCNAQKSLQGPRSKVRGTDTGRKIWPLKALM
ncbi:neurogenic differentiation factor 4 [Paramuricea clavata]|uniref:Neurogenic differentiation factor 4 n=1 Tax=Paramuricea clavata TaxID=317549 RepID=A0A7D9DJI7_PARCT|nr:neurogenic differentiation factor 4 [Paramuricea clavata]